MRWPETSNLIERIKAERPELTVVAHASAGAKWHSFLRVCCVTKDGLRLGHATLHSAGAWKRYKADHPEPFCRPEESRHADALGRETDHHGLAIPHEPPPARPITAEEVLNRIVALGRADPHWREEPDVVAEMAAAWGARTDRRGFMTDFESDEAARLAPDCHASVLIARTGSGLFASGFAARWGDGSTIMAPSIGSVPFDTEFEARRAAFRDLIDTLRTARGNQQRQLLLAAVEGRDRERGLFT